MVAQHFLPEKFNQVNPSDLKLSYTVLEGHGNKDVVMLNYGHSSDEKDMQIINQGLEKYISQPFIGWYLFMHWDWDKMGDILQTTFPYMFLSVTIVVFWFKFHWNMFPRV